MKAPNWFSDTRFAAYAYRVFFNFLENYGIVRGVLEAGFKGGDLTPAGIRRAAANVTVESDGLMGARELGQNRADIEGTVNKPDASVASGTSSLAVKYAGPTAKAYDWEQGPSS